MRWRKAALLGLDAALVSTAYVASFWLRLGSEKTVEQADLILHTLPVVVVVSLVVHAFCGLYSGILRYASVETAVAVLKGATTSVLLACLILFLLFRLQGVPRSLFIIHAMAVVLLVGGSRFAVRARFKRQRATADSKWIVLYGAGDNAALVLRGLRQSAELKYAPLALLDDDRRKHGREIHGVRIHGGLDKLRLVCAKETVAELWVCALGVPGKRLREIYTLAREIGVAVKILPRLDHSLMENDLSRFQEPEISDLLRRPSRKLDQDRMRSWIRGRRVLVTGAGGSIGSELVSQIARFEPQAIAVCDSCESNLFHVHRRLTRNFPTLQVEPFLVDIRDQRSVRGMFEKARPQLVFHAAAYKHVPLVERNPCSGVLTNVHGLCNTALAAIAVGVSEFVFISTDKAVLPANVMGATKRLGEVIIQLLTRESRTRFCAVRFGNVLGSSGSAVPIFQEQIRRGGPVTVTHPEMTRYFMLVSEAVELVIQAGSICTAGEVFLLDMGEPVRISDLAADLIRLMGKEPERDVRIQYTGVRPGEKIHEDLLIRPQDVRTPFRDIRIDGEPARSLEWDVFAEGLNHLVNAAREGDSTRVICLLKHLEPRFTPIFSETIDALRQSVDVLESLEAPRAGPTRNRSRFAIPSLEEIRDLRDEGAPPYSVRTETLS